VCLRPGVFLLNPRFRDIIEKLPEKFKKWKFLIPEDLTENLDVTGMTDIDIRLASSRGMDINVLSIDENTVVVNKRAIGVKKCLEQNGFDIIEVELDNGEIFAGGIHCSTLDIIREDEYIYYD
jgi:glycine amidinotransferase